MEPAHSLARESQPMPADPDTQSANSETVLAPPRMWLGHSSVIAAVWLCGSLACILLAANMRVGDNRRVYLRGFEQPIPETCWSYGRLGLDCPGCGLTRTFVHLTHAEFTQAWQLNPVGWLVFLFAMAQIPCGIAQLVFRSRARWVEAWGTWNDWCSAFLVIALLLQWIVRMSGSLLG